MGFRESGFDTHCTISITTSQIQVHQDFGFKKLFQDLSTFGFLLFDFVGLRIL
jgi:hypothetical protein